MTMYLKLRYIFIHASRACYIYLSPIRKKLHVEHGLRKNFNRHNFVFKFLTVWYARLRLRLYKMSIWIIYYTLFEDAQKSFEEWAQEFRRTCKFLEDNFAKYSRKRPASKLRLEINNYSISWHYSIDFEETVSGDFCHIFHESSPSILYSLCLL